MTATIQISPPINGRLTASVTISRPSSSDVPNPRAVGSPEHAPAHAEHVVGVGAKEFLEGVRIAAAGSCDDLLRRLARQLVSAPRAPCRVKRIEKWQPGYGAYRPNVPESETRGTDLDQWSDSPLGAFSTRARPR